MKMKFYFPQMKGKRHTTTITIHEVFLSYLNFVVLDGRKQQQPE